MKVSFLLRSICFLFLVSTFLNTFVSSIQHLCHPDEKDALLAFKTEFVIQKPDFVYFNVSSYPKTESWVNKSDCCSWDGITCDTKSGKVIGLDLSSSDLHGELKSNSSLFRLRHLRDLNLAYNNFTASPIPTEFNKLMGLERLNLSESSLSGQISNKVLQLTKLVSLDLSSYYPSSIPLSIAESFLLLLAQNLRNLRKLDMRSVNISSEIPNEFSNMRSLRFLDLTECNLFGEFPSSVLLMPSLQSIRLSRNLNLRGNLPVFHENNSLLGLSIELTAFSGTIPDSISSLKQLTFLTLSFSEFSGKIPFSLGNLFHLYDLDLSSNNFVGEIPSSIGNLNQLAYFNVGANKLSGNLPATISNLTQLRVLSLYSNEFTGSLPPNISQLSKLEEFSAYHNSFTGAILLSQLKIPSLKYISLDYNQPNDLLGIENISMLPNLIAISISHSSYNKIGLIDLNVFSPLKQLSLLDLWGIPLSTANITSDSDFPSNLKELILSGCNITEFPEFIRNERNLEWLDLSNNKIGLIDLNVFSPLKQLSFLDLSGIPLSTANITFDFSSNLEYLYLRGCNITEFPEFIRNGRNLKRLDLPNNKIKGQVPDWLWRLPVLDTVDLSNNSLSSFNESFSSFPESKIDTLDLSSNAFQGPLFIPSRYLRYFLGSKNNFSGEIPRSICGQSSLDVLDLSDNNLHGSIPWCLETLMSSLSDLNLRNNMLSGSLPEIFMNANKLESLDVSHNRLEGKLPASLTGCSALEVLNVGSNRINDTFPFQLNSLPKLQVLVIRSNKFHGMLHNADGVWFGFPQLKIIDASYNDFLDTLPSDYFLNWTIMSSNTENNMEPKYMGSSGGYYSLVLMSKGVSMEMERILTIYTAIDFSGNQLHGQIPDSIGLLKELRILNLSSNAFTGHIPSSMASLTNLESLDLSQNKISGEIPPELGTLSSLEVINVSHNQLEGSIPQGTQFQRQQCSSYEGNPGLNRPSLKDVCRDIKAPPQHEPLETKEEEEEEESLSWIAAGLGFGPGVVFGLAMGYIVTSYKHEWFMKTFGRSKQRSTITR